MNIVEKLEFLYKNDRQEQALGQNYSIFRAVEHKVDGKLLGGWK